MLDLDTEYWYDGIRCLKSDLEIELLPHADTLLIPLTTRFYLTTLGLVSSIKDPLLFSNSLDLLFSSP
jgi:hypothetical protein